MFLGENPQASSLVSTWMLASLLAAHAWYEWVPTDLFKHIGVLVSALIESLASPCWDQIVTQEASGSPEENSVRAELQKLARCCETQYRQLTSVRCRYPEGSSQPGTFARCMDFAFCCTDLFLLRSTGRPLDCLRLEQWFQSSCWTFTPSDERCGCAQAAAVLDRICGGVEDELRDALINPSYVPMLVAQLDGESAEDPTEGVTPLDESGADGTTDARDALARVFLTCVSGCKAHTSRQVSGGNLVQARAPSDLPS